MDKYEYKIKAEQIRKLAKEGDYSAAMKIADTIDWRRVKNVAMLCLVSDVYEKNLKYEDSQELLLMAYDRSPIGRIIVYRLAELAVKMGNFEEAVEYYSEFVHLSPGDPSADILKYKIYHAKGASEEQLISILEAFKEKEYHEEWAYELARLYHRAGMGPQCIDECNQIFLWFREGKFVDRALELKMLYQPLSKEQQERYDHRNDKKTETIQSQEEQGKTEQPDLVRMTEDMLHSSIEQSDFSIQPVHVSKFDTVNLQAELAKSMEEIMSATEKETVDSTMENIRRLIEDSQIIKLEFEEEGNAKEKDEAAIKVEVPTAQVKSESDLHKENMFQKVLAEEKDGQISLYMPEANILEKQITGQISIADILNEWENVKRKAEAAIREAERQRLYDTKEKALKKAEQIMHQLSYAVSQINEEPGMEEAAATSESASGNEEQEEPKLGEASVEQQTAMENPLEKVTTEEAEIKAEVESDIEPEIEQEKEIETEQEVESEGSQVQEAECVQEQETEQKTESERESESEAKPEIKSEPESETKPETDVPPVLSENNPVKTGYTAMISQNLVDLIEKEMEFRGEAELSSALRDVDTTQDYQLTEEQKDIFSAFLQVRDLEAQLNRMVMPINQAVEQNQPYVPGFVAIVGEEGSGKTTLGMAIAKMIQAAQGRKNGKLAKITGESLNKKEMKPLMEKMSGGFLIIEKAGQLTNQSIQQMMEAIRELSDPVMLIVEDGKVQMDYFFSLDKDFTSNFTYVIRLPEYNNDELVLFGKIYAQSLTYRIDDMAVLAFYSCVDRLQREEHVVSIDEVKEIIDKAINRSKKKHFKNSIKKMMGRRYDENGLIILYEKDFEAI